MISPVVNNPFASGAVGDTWSPPPTNVPELHRPVLDACLRLLGTVRDKGAGTGLLVRGEAGSGKTHLIAQLRHELSGEPTKLVVYLPLSGAYAGRLWRHVRQRLATELLKPVGPSGLTGMQAVLRNRFPELSAKAGSKLLDWLTGSSGQADLRALLERFGENHDIPYEFPAVIPKLADKAARYWLRGTTLSDDDLKGLGLPPGPAADQDQEHAAREVVLGLCRLAGDRTTLCFCFDELEGIQAGVRDDAALREFTTLATQLVTEPGPRLVVTFVRPDVMVTIQRAVEKSNVEKIAQFRADIPPLDRWEWVVKLVLGRLEADAGVKAERAAHQGDQLWPFSPAFLQDVLAANKLTLTPRHLLGRCRLEFDRLQQGKPREEWLDLSDSLPRLWEQRRDRHKQRAVALSFAEVLAKGLPWLAEASDLPLRRADATDPRLRDVHLIFRPSPPEKHLKVGVSLIDSSPGKVWRQLDRLIADWEKHGAQSLDRLVVARYEKDKALTDSSRERIDKLVRAGAVYLEIPAQQLAKLAAFQELLEKSHTGAITDGGKPITAEAYHNWTQTNLSSAVKELADAVFGTHIAPPAAAPAPAPPVVVTKTAVKSSPKPVAAKAKKG